MPPPNRAIAPPAAHTNMISGADDTNRATTEGFIKIPDPIMPPMTIKAASRVPSRRNKCGKVLRPWLRRREHPLGERFDDRRELLDAMQRRGVGGAANDSEPG